MRFWSAREKIALLYDIHRSIYIDNDAKQRCFILCTPIIVTRKSRRGRIAQPRTPHRFVWIVIAVSENDEGLSEHEGHTEY